MSPLAALPSMTEADLAYEFFFADYFQVFDMEDLYLEEDKKIEKSSHRNKRHVTEASRN